ncbi:hypothetical protein ACT7V1_004611 [Salmonella enterica subsp. enterica]
MTMNTHTQTSVTNTAPATSVSPLEQSGSTKTTFIESQDYEYLSIVASTTGFRFFVLGVSSCVIVLKQIISGEMYAVIFTDTNKIRVYDREYSDTSRMGELSDYDIARLKLLGKKA